MKKRVISLLLACALLCSMLPYQVLEANAVTQSSYPPYAMIEYGYSSTVTCGTVRYISQVSYDSYFYSAYWPSSTFGYYTGPSVECGTASLSMALSYIGVNKTPDDILTPYNGATNFSLGWGGSTYYSVSASAISTAVDRYINGNGKYSPPVIHIPGYSSAGHYVVVVGRISSNQYQILDPWQRALTSATINGSSATYTVYGSTIYDTIDQIHQWYNASASLDTEVTFDPNGGSCATTTKTVTPGSAIGTLPTATRDGYVFAGWYPSVNGGSDPITADTTVTGATTFYAHWISPAYVGNKITFDAAGGSLPTHSAAQTITGFNTSRGQNALIVYNCGGQSVATDASGVEVAVDSTGKVVGKRTYGAIGTLSVPSGGFVLSGYGTNSFVANIAVGDYAAYDESTMTAYVYPSQSAYLSRWKYVTNGSTYGTLPMPANGEAPFLGWYTAASGGTQITSGSTYSVSKLYARWGCVHSYATTVTPGTCEKYETVTYTCSACGESYTAYADEICTDWSETKPTGIDSSLVESKTQYRYSDYETLTSEASSLDGYTQTGSEWVHKETKTNAYVPSWPSGFSTSNGLYTTYSNSKIQSSETESTKTVVNSDKLVGYLYYHWCYADSYYSLSYKSGSYTTFHAYYSETDPSNYTCDTSDMSYCTAHSTCSNSDWFFVTEVYEQDYSLYSKLYSYERWTDWSPWGDTVYTATDSRKVEERTVYRYVNADLARHLYVNGICTVCGTTCNHSWSIGRCSVCAMFCNHSWSNGKCGVCGVTCGHSWSEGVCFTCGTVCEHNYVNHTCVTCGMDEPVSDYYLFGYINGAEYGCETDYANMGEYKFVDGVLKATFNSDSYVGVKTDNNKVWYKTDGWLGYDVTSATLYDATTLGANADMLFVPGGVEVTFTLVDNGNDTFTLSYVAAEKEMVTPTITPKYPSLSFEGEIFINVYYEVANMDDVVEMGLFASADTVMDANDAHLAGYEWDEAKQLYCVRTEGIPAKNLGDMIYFKVYAKLSDGSYVYSSGYGYSPKLYAKDRIANSTSTEMKALCVAMLNYGAAAQTHFGYKTDSLMNEGIDQSLVKAYESGMVSDLASVSSSKVGAFAYNSDGYTSRYPSVSFEGAFAINYYFTPALTVDGAMTLYYWNLNDYASASVLTTSNATGSIVMTNNGVNYEAAVSGIAAKEIDQTIFVAGVYSSGGVNYATGVLPYSLGAYCVDRINNGSGTMQAFAQATAVYGYYAKQYFA